VPRLSIRIDFDDEGRLGPGKVTLLERKALSATARHVKALQAISRSPRRT